MGEELRQAKPKTKKAFALCQLKITLANTKPAVWRRILVRDDVNLGLLHAIIQVAMGWTNSHLHMFFIGHERYSDPEFELNDKSANNMMVKDENKITLAQVAVNSNAFEYEYDFGDSWRHKIAIEKMGLDAAGFQGFAICTAGERACPPEDCGAPPGFANLLEVIKNPDHAEYESMMEWLGGEFDPEAFDVQLTTQYLQKIKRHNISPDKLAEILMERDGYETCDS